MDAIGLAVTSDVQHPAAPLPGEGWTPHQRRAAQQSRCGASGPVGFALSINRFMDELGFLQAGGQDSSGRAACLHLRTQEKSTQG